MTSNNSPDFRSSHRYAGPFAEDAWKGNDLVGAPVDVDMQNEDGDTLTYEIVDSCQTDESADALRTANRARADERLVS